MHDVPDDERSIKTPAEEDAAFERAVLDHILHVYPVQLTLDELIREVAEDPGDFPTRDGIQRAARDLAKVGVLHRTGDFVLPTHAAIRINELWDLVT